MSTPDLAQHLAAHLTPHLGPAEAASVTRLVMEDLFDYRKGQRPRLLSPEEEARANTTLERLQAGEPVQYVTGIADFYDLQLKVTPAVLIPRPETEELVEWILEDHAKGTQQMVADIGTGSGCIPLALKSRRPQWGCQGYDISTEALAIATDNAMQLDLNCQFIKGDVLKDSFSLLPTSLDILISNPPYIPPSEIDRMGKSTITHEPKLALFAPEDDPLIFYRRIAALGLEALKPTGHLYFETNEFNSEQVVSTLQQGGYTQVQRRQDLQGKWRMVKASR